MSGPTRSSIRALRHVAAAALCCLVILGGMACSRSPGTRQAPQGGRQRAGAVALMDADFNQKTADGVVLVDFWAAWCPPCRQQGPIVAALAEAYAGRATIAKLDVDRNPQTARRLGIRNIPTLIVFKDGAEFRRLVGLQDRARLRQALDAALDAS